MSPRARPRVRRRWTLQARLMVTIIGMVTLILAGVALTISAFLGTILQDNLTARVTETANLTNANILRMTGPRGLTSGITAYDVLTEGRQDAGVLVVLASTIGTSGAVVDADGSVTELDSQQVDTIIDASVGGASDMITVPTLGDYRFGVYRVQDGLMYIGLPTSEVQSTIAAIGTTVLFVTAAGLVLLGVTIAVVIRAGLRPLRAVADTATRVADVPMAEGDVSITARVPDAQADEHTEIGRVGHALNTLLDHVDASLHARQRNEERMRRFVADASHELRTPLASIRGYSELSLRALHSRAEEGSAPDDTTQALERIQAQSLRMTTLVEDLLLLARLDEGQELVYGSVDLTLLAIEALGDARPAGPEHDWVLDIDDEPVVIAGDTARLHQVVANLLANARTHTPAGTTVTLRVTREGDEAVVRVHDDGPGVEPTLQDELFERFSRADRSRARKTGGTGLGLSIARAIVEAHHGTITVDSVPGDTTFEVRLPARPADPADPAVAPGPAQ